MPQAGKQPGIAIHLSPASLKRAAGRPGMIYENGHLRLSFFGATYALSMDRILGPDGEPPTQAVAEVLQDIETCLSRQAIFTLGTFLCGRLVSGIYPAG